MKKNIDKLKTVKKSIFNSYRVVFITCKVLMLLFFILKIIIATIPLLHLYLLNLTLNEVVSSEPFIPSIVWLVVLLCVSSITGYLSNVALNSVKKNMESKIIKYTQMRYYEKICSISISIFDTPDGRDSAQCAEHLHDNPYVVFSLTVDIISSFYSFFAVAIILFQFNTLFSILLLVLSIPITITGYSQTALFNKFERNNLANTRFHSYFKWILTSRETARDLRMYDLKDYMEGKYKTYLSKYLGERRQLKNSYLKLELLFKIIQLSGVLSFIALIVFSAYKGEITIGELTMYTGFAFSFTGSFMSIVSTFDFVVGISIWMKDAIKFFKSEEENCSGEEICHFKSLEFINVSFTYPQSDKPVLKDVSFSIHRGETVSLLGVNGAGKTTIVKLILGLYKPTSGKILVNGQIIENYDLNSLRNLYSVLFQEYVNYPLTLREAISANKPGDMDNDELIISSIKRSGLSEIFDEADLETFLSKQFDDDGIELSKGQWQKMALARTYFKDSDVLIFDEPSSSLDPIAEEELFLQFEKIAKNKTGIMISHRISSAILSNRIIVLNEGIIEEQGTHDSLMQKKGLYSKLFNLQKKKYTV